MSSPKVIVFGPTGAVGSAAARTAASLGSPVFLAMRDPSKPIRGLTSAAEGAGNYKRVQADLTDPASVSSAVTSTGAKHAFIYLAHGGSDHMRGTIEALKAAGIELVVFLSSFTVTGDLKAIEPTELIPYVHAQVEIVLGDVFGEEGYIAARPGSFASNTLQYKAALQKGEVGIYRPEASVDSIVPEDIGAVCGTALVKGPLAGERKLYLYGPALMTQEEQVKVLGRVLGKEPKIEELDADAAYKQAVEVRKVPPPVAKYMVGQVKKAVSDQLQVFGFPIKEEDLSTVQKYLGKKGTTFQEWAEQNKNLFLS